MIGKEFIYIIYGKEYEQAWICAMVVIVGTFFNLSNAVVINVIDIMLKRHIRSLIMMITTALNIILTIIGIAYIGIFGAALATAISMIIQTIMLNIFYQKKLDIFSAYLLKKSFKGILEYIILACLVSVILKGFVPDVWTRFIVGGISFCIIFFGCYMLFGANERERNIIKKFLKIY